MHGSAIYLQFIRDDKSKCNWLKELTQAWERNIHTISKTTYKYPQEIYAVVVWLIQSEWIFRQSVKKTKGYTFARVDKMLRETFLPRLFFGKSKYLSPITGTLSIMAVINPSWVSWILLHSRTKTSKFVTCKQIFYFIRDGGRRIFQRQSPSGA